MYVAFSLKERGENLFIDETSLAFSHREPKEAEFYVLDSDYPNIFIPGKCSLSGEYYSPNHIMFPQWRFDVDKYNRGEDPFVYHDPLSDPVFLAALRRYDMFDSIMDTIPLMTEIKNCRLLINQLFDVLISAGLVSEKPGRLEDWNSTIEDIKSMYPKVSDGWSFREVIQKRNEKKDNEELEQIENDYIRRQTERSEYVLRDARNNKGRLKSYNRIRDRLERRKRIDAAKKNRPQD